MTRPRQTIAHLKADLLTAHPDNIRDDLGDLTDLARSIIEHGILQPITVTERTAGGYLILAGRKVWMLATFDPELGPDRARCHLMISDHCRGILDYATVTADRLDTGGSYARGGIAPACAPCQSLQGALVTHGQWPVGAA